MSGTISIALDGPGGAGKSSVAKEIARLCGYKYVDTGAMYRCIGLYVMRRGVNPEDRSEVIKLLPEIKLEISYAADGTQTMLLNGENVTGSIRTPEISMYSSAVSAIGEVRAFLLDTQRDMARKNNVIMDGRDIGTVILPNAEVKIFLTASAEIRARRRYDELRAKGIEQTYEEVLSDMLIRDKNDSERETAPLKPADDAIILDTSLLNLQQVIQAVLNIIEEKRKTL